MLKMMKEEESESLAQKVFQEKLKSSDVRQAARYAREALVSEGEKRAAKQIVAGLREGGHFTIAERIAEQWKI